MYTLFPPPRKNTHKETASGKTAFKEARSRETADEEATSDQAGARDTARIGDAAGIRSTAGTEGTGAKAGSEGKNYRRSVVVQSADFLYPHQHDR